MLEANPFITFKWPFPTCGEWVKNADLDNLKDLDFIVFCVAIVASLVNTLDQPVCRDDDDL